ncbi:MAG: hypothetical protein FWD69_04410 [Polyangiaceae bacterium]|nr:hypothetical protein [Polyangiaceae bacterium]
MKGRIAFAPLLVAALIFACSSNSMNQDDTGGSDGNASMTFALSGGDFTGNSVRICGSRPAPDPKYRCNDSLTPDIEAGTDAGDACPCFNFNPDGSLVDGTGAPAVITGLCPSADFPTANWAFSYALFSAPDCGGTQLNDGTHNFTCYDSTDIASQTFPNQSAEDVLNPGLNTNHVLCNTDNASKSWNFGSCATATTPADTDAGNVRFDCGCTPAAGTCDCGDGGVMDADLEIGCSFDSLTCNILCGPPVVAPQGSCTPASAPSVLVSGTDVLVYVPHGIGTLGQNSRTAISIVPVEGTSFPSSAYIWSTTVPLLSCASNSVTGQTVCTGSDASVHLFSDVTPGAILTSSATGQIQSNFAGCTNCGVVMDPIHNRALISMSVGGVPGFQFLDLSTNTFLPPFTSPTTEMTIGFLLDPIRNLVLAPTVSNTYEIIDVTDPSAPKFSERTTNINSPFVDFSAAGEDCTTGIVASSLAHFDRYFDDPIPSDVYLSDLRQTTFTAGTPAGTWSGPTQIQTLSLENINFFYGPSSVAIAQGTHQGVMSDIAGHSLTAIQLPSNPGRRTPAISDWVSCDITPGVSGFFFQTVTAYTSPNTGHAMAVVSPFPYGLAGMAVVDLTLMLDPAVVPRTAAGHACADGTLPASVLHFFPSS